MNIELTLKEATRTLNVATLVLAIIALCALSQTTKLLFDLKTERFSSELFVALVGGMIAVFFNLSGRFVLLIVKALAAPPSSPQSK